MKINHEAGKCGTDFPLTLKLGYLCIKNRTNFKHDCGQRIFVYVGCLWPMWVWRSADDGGPARDVPIKCPPQSPIWINTDGCPGQHLPHSAISQAHVRYHAMFTLWTVPPRSNTRHAKKCWTISGSKYLSILWDLKRYDLQMWEWFYLWRIFLDLFVPHHLCLK